MKPKTKFTKNLMITETEMNSAKVVISVEVKIRGMKKVYASRKIKFKELSLKEFNYLMKIINHKPPLTNAKDHCNSRSLCSSRSH